MDTVRQHLPLTCVPELASAFTVFKFICSSVNQAQVSKSQLEALADSIAQLLRVLDKEYRTKQLLQDVTLVALANLSRFVIGCICKNTNLIPDTRLLEDISSFVHRGASSSFLKLLFTKHQRMARIDAYYRQIGTLIQSFQVCTLYNIPK